MTQQDQTQPTNSQDAAFREEVLHLAAVVGSIDTRIQRGEHMSQFHAGTPQAAYKTKEMHEEGQRRAKSVRDRPYFGRIDYFIADEEDASTIYIGEVNLNSDNPRYFIASRNAPIAELYYNPAGGSYAPPAGKVSARVNLKRMLTVEEARLIDMQDVLRLAPGVSQSRALSSRALDEKLAAPSQRQLSDIVQTIQPEQYKQIASTAQPVLIVQGAAGSGKSLVGLHRIDFLLSRFSHIGNLHRPTPERTIMFGPSAAFLSYVSSLLPGLGVDRVRQVTLTSWLASQLPRGLSLSRRDRIFEDLMNNRRKLSKAEIDAHHFKTGLKMKRLLDRYVSRLRRDILNQVRGVKAIEFPGNPPLRLDGSDLQRRVADAFRVDQYPNAARRRLVNSLAETWAQSHSPGRLPRYEALANGRRTVERMLSPYWPLADVRSVYIGLIQSPQEVQRFARPGDIDADGAAEITKTAPRDTGRALGLTDVPAALYLHYSLNGVDGEPFEHIVVDEAQDVSPLELALLQMHLVAGGAMTILGDLRQGILPYKSIENWSQLASLFPKEDVARVESRQTYRSTRQITQYANRILQGLPRRTETPESYGRSGATPRLSPSRSAKGMRIAIAESILRLLGLGEIGSVAVLTKWRKSAQEIEASLEEEGIGSVGLLSPEGTMQSNITVSPIVLTKGLEFDAVVIANARKDNFFDTELDRMLLYLACTRARHHLEIHWHGTRSPIVPDVSRLIQ